ncbi:HD domain-containing protein [Acinetobacter pittii]|uniref:HD domain-containing protein n=2 Tax=Acinetobacter pittii TaxID=48296 RepID=UPI0009BDFAA3|nr:ATP-binding protein [Acinetobacter pittii]MCE5999377.1 ATP-binding protein [Acinetobacter pittii]SSV83051.1 HSP90 family protein [Acinetobacter pittii]
MSTQLIAHLKKKCETDDNVKILLSQWEFDQKLVGKALENIGGFYPHFSNHNASHSQQILVNIERILGKDIELLSTTDTWLILESAYWHDVGMLVDAKSAKEVHGNDDFKFMVKTIAQDKGHDLHTFCLAYEQNGWVGAIGSQDHPFDGVEKYRQLIAEWFRRNHDKRIGGLVEDPFEFLNITSPRTELLPKRIYRYLGQICMSHGMNFTDLMEKLPFKQTGLGREDCHPRFIGCLLRLGDLFDLDDNRFCPVMAKHLSHQPRLSKAHEDKHLSLREFQLDKRTVKLVAECPNEMAYVETQNWFGWIREEFQNQMSQWNLIVPNPNFGSLPTIEQLDVNINGNKKLLDQKPMKFSLEEKNAIQILQGGNLYTDISSILRELIQNSIDASLIRVSLEHKNKLKNLSPVDDIFIDTLKKYPIEISFIKEGDKAYLKIKDRGVGFSLEDLKYVQKIAGSRKNIKRTKIISEMEQWMKPSSYFGIGLQSAFLLSEKLIFETKSFITGDSFWVEMNSPLENNNGYCFINKIGNNYDDFGTELKVELNIKELSKSFFVEENYLKKRGFIKNDYILKTELVFIEIIKKIKEKFIGNTTFPLIFDENLDKYLKEILQEDEFQLNKTYKTFDYTYWNHNLNLKIMINKKKFKAGNNTNFYFKGQRADCRGWNFKFPLSSFYDFSFDFYGFDAKDCLNVNRDIWLKSFVEIFNEKIVDEILEDILNRRNGFEYIFSEFYNLVNLYYGKNIRDLSGIEFNTSLGYLKLEEIKKFNNIYLTTYYYEHHDATPGVFKPDVIVLIDDLKIIDNFISSMQPFCCYKVEGLKFLAIRGDISLIFTDQQITLDNNNVKVYQIESMVKSLQYFLETKIIYQSEQRRENDSFQDVDFPIIADQDVFSSDYKIFSFENKVVFPLYYTVKEIHIIPYDEYLSLLTEHIRVNITIELYNDFIGFLKQEIQKISSIKITG